MPTFVIETYLPRTRAEDLDRAVAELQRAAAAASSPEARARHIRSFYVGADELLYHLVEAPSLEVITLIGHAAGLTADRIVEALSR